MKNFKKVVFILSCISLLFSITFIVQTYAKYATSISGSSDINIAKWDIIVNDENIKTNSNLTNVISPVFPGNSNIASNVIAPTAEGYFDLAFDFSQVDVSFDYNISISVNSNSSVTDLVATGYSVDDGLTQPFDSSQTISNHVNYSDDHSAPVNIRVYIKWEDGTGAMMNNTDDTLATLPDASSQARPAIFDVTVSFTQTPV
ncbi:MAG: hypothetical protein FWF46_01710 [Oscillospiraceae bacterium]|nr:hypothetical protein [Oscillospiraceae bacterium]